MVRARRILAMAAASAVALAGCGVGLGPGRGTSDVNVTVTRGFGSTEIASVTKTKVPGSETVMRMLERSFQRADALRRRLRRVDRRAHRGLGAPRLVLLRQRHPGASGRGHDRRPSGRPDLVGPPRLERHRLGPGGRRLLSRAVRPRASTASGSRRRSNAPPTSATACKQVSADLNAIGVPVASQLLGTGSGQDTLGVLVGTWSDMRVDARRQPDRAGAQGEWRLRQVRRSGSSARWSCSTRRRRRAHADRQCRPDRRHGAGHLDADVADHRHRPRRRGGGGRGA